jgi:hypothetical protein
VISPSSSFVNRRPTRDARHRRRARQLDLLWLGRRRAPRRRHLHPDRDGKLNGVDPRAWLADVLARLPDHPAKQIDQLLPWNWSAPLEDAEAA